MRPQYTWTPEPTGEFIPIKVEYHRMILPTKTELRSYIRRIQKKLFKEDNPDRKYKLRCIIDEFKTLSEIL